MNFKPKNSTIWGTTCTIIATIVLFIIVFGTQTATHPTTNFFALHSDDAIKDIYATTYHVKYDSSFLRCDGMNYPYGDYYTYTGTQTWISFPLQILHKMGVPNTDQYVLGCINFIIILSIVFCAVFLFLLFKELKLPNFISILGAVAITFLSPQLRRIGCHLTLSYEFILPLMLLLMVKIHHTHQLKYSILFGIVFFLSGFAHPYYLVFFATISVGYCLFLFIVNLMEKKKMIHTAGEAQLPMVKIIIAFCFQFLIPAILFLFLSQIGDVATDRTRIPDGFYQYGGRVEGLLFPYAKPYFYENSQLFDYVEWEAQSYIGIIAFVLLIILIVKLFRNIFKKKFVHILSPTDSLILNFFFWSALLLVIFSCGFPINLFPDNILNYIPFLPQMRAQGRFLWLFFYVINILAIYYFYNYFSKLKSTKIKYIFITSMFLLYALEDYANCWNYKYYCANSWNEWTDYNNELPENEWIKKIDTSEYQSILPLHFFNVGTEQVYLASNMLPSAAYVSVKTGLPMHACSSCRMPIKQTYNNISLRWKPYANYSVLADLPNHKSILVITQAKDQSLDENEKRFLRYSTFLFSANNIDFYRLTIDSLYKLCDDFQQVLYDDYQSNKKYENMPDVFSNDSCGNFDFRTWESTSTPNAFEGNGALQGVANQENVIYKGNPFKNIPTKAELSFWVSNFTDDLYGRSRFEIYSVNKKGEKYLFRDGRLADYASAIKEGWGLICIEAEIPQDCERMILTVRNKEMLPKPIYFDNLLIRPIDTHVSVVGSTCFYDNLPVIKAK